jgi:hypothetical protein
METKNLDSAYKKAANLLTTEIKEKVKSGPTRAYNTGRLYDSISSTVKEISTGETIEVSMLEYGKYTDTGTIYIDARGFTKAGLQSADAEIEELIGRAAVDDIVISMDQILD